MTKLVRDNIPNIAPHRKFRQVTGMELLQFVEQKILEESEEVVGASPDKFHLTEELADLHQVMLKLAEISGISWEDVLAAGEAKNLTKGKFDANWILDEEV